MADRALSPVLQPAIIGDLHHLHLKNRVVMPALTRSRSSEDGVPPAYAAEYYGQRATAGLIVTEATNISAQGRGYAFTPGIWSPAQVAAWRPIVDAVHRHGGLFFMQLWHTGRFSHPDFHDGALPVSASAIRPEGQIFTRDGMKDLVTPRALRTDEIPWIVDDYQRAALNAKAAGFDGVEIHCANNYLLEQFLRDSTNRRTDQYGGSIENRLRFPLAVVEAVVDVWGPKRVGIRISPATTAPGETPLDSTPMETFGAFADALSAKGLLYLHAIEGETQQNREAQGGISFPALRHRFAGAYIANNQYTLDLAEAALAKGHADLFSFGRPFLANPDLVDRLRTGAPLAEAPKQYWYGGSSVGYSDWPAIDPQYNAAG
jgi:N-ethylmaleimide reductase